MNTILIVGGGPAGAAAAISARLEGATVRLADQSRDIRHKVCGEFLSPVCAEILEKLQLWHKFTALEPSSIRRCVLHLGRRTQQWKLPERAWGLSRYHLDRALIEKAGEIGATISLGERVDYRAANLARQPKILACGRTQKPDQKDRLFGFKTHFEGPSNDAVELFFSTFGYVGVSGIERGLTNVCGIAPESVLRRYRFDFDEIVLRSPALRERLSPLTRRMGWLTTGPLTFAPASTCKPAYAIYPAGDSLAFIDPFTGSGILNALFTGRLAGIAAARQVSSVDYLKACRSLLGRPFLLSSMLRRLLKYTEVHWLTNYVPGRTLFRLTRADLSESALENSARRLL